MSTVSVASSFARRLVEAEARRCGIPINSAARIVASRLKYPTNAVWSLLFKAPKRVNADLLFALEAAVVREIEREMGRLAHELETLRRGVGRVDPGTIAEVEAGLAALRSKLEGADQ